MPLHRHRPPPPGTPRRLRSLLGGLLVCWLLTQALGHAHGLLHLPRPAAPARATVVDPSCVEGTAATPSAATGARPATGGTLGAVLARAFHPPGDATGTDDGVCRLYGHLAHGELAPSTAPLPAAREEPAAPPAPAVVAAGTAPRRGVQARGPPGRG